LQVADGVVYRCVFVCVVPSIMDTAAGYNPDPVPVAKSYNAFRGVRLSAPGPMDTPAKDLKN
jgi:hypothetical protein